MAIESIVLLVDEDTDFWVVIAARLLLHCRAHRLIIPRQLIVKVSLLFQALGFGVHCVVHKVVDELVVALDASFQVLGQLHPRPFLEVARVRLSIVVPLTVVSRHLVHQVLVVHRLVQGLVVAPVQCISVHFYLVLADEDLGLGLVHPR